MAKRCSLSVTQIKFVETGRRRLARGAALAIAFATGVSVDWLLGRGRRWPIITPSGAKWTGQIYEKCSSRKHDAEYAGSEAVFANFAFVEGVNVLAQIICSAYRNARTQLAVQLMNETLRELGRRLRPVETWSSEPPGQTNFLHRGSLNKKLTRIVDRFEASLNDSFDDRAYRPKLAKPKWQKR